MAKLTSAEKSLLTKTFVRNSCIFFGSNNISMQGRAFAFSMLPVLREYYKDDPEEMRKSFVRYNELFNTHACMAGLIAGICVAMEKEKAQKGSVDGETISRIKTSLMGPTAGVGDAFFFNCIRVIAAGIGIGFASQGNILGALLFVLIYGGSYLVIKAFLLVQGYKVGTKLIDEAFKSGVIPIVTKLAGIVGMTMVGAMIATNVTINVVAKPVFNGAVVDIQAALDMIAPGLLSLILWFVLMKFVRKGINPVWLVLAVIVICVILAALGIL